MAHIRKRQFQSSGTPNQSSITSFFTRIDPSNPPADYDPYDRKHQPAFAPPLPDPVQSQLMNMGMRIRKSVPEGYKTHKTLPTSSAPPMMAPTTRKPTLTPSESAPSSSAPATLYTKPNELVPMCGLHKIGGYASQPTSSLPALSHSQSTLASSWSSTAAQSTPNASHMNNNSNNNLRKRSYDDEIEDELDAIFSDEQGDEDDVDNDTLDGKSSPAGNSSKSKTRPFSHSSMPELDRKSGIINPGSRPKARMRARASPGTLAANSLASSTAINDFDDGDVNFLQPMDCD
ncbi:hypothetical protein AAFC00_003112 [Neodothiora populina]|uniref:Uncharacterized protein n=1 Tax=Neodothiora populina TaxID=2781224 RepID=A0ABR3P9K9_9PEZI